MRPFIAIALVRPRRIVELFVFVTVLLILLNCAVLILKHEFGHGNVFGLIDFFDLDGENNAPTFFAGFQLLTCMALLAYVAHIEQMARNRNVFHWLLLSAIFLYLAFDEVCSVHEKWIEPLRARFHTHGIFYFAWVLVAVPALILLALTFARFVFALPMRTRILFVLAGFIYVGGAVGMELAGSWYWDHYGSEHGMYAVLTTIEESMEMSGLDLFIYAVLDHIAESVPKYQLVLPTNAETP